MRDYCKIFSINWDTLYESKHKTILKWFRYTTIIPSGFLFMFFLIFLQGSMFLYLTYWSVTLTFLYFLTVSISYQSSSLHPFSYILFEIILPLNLVITAFFWCFIFPLSGDIEFLGQYIAAHSFSLLVTIIDFSLSSLIIHRQHYIFPILILFLYIFSTLLPFTLTFKVLYPGMTFDNGFTYIVFFIFFVLVLAVLEIGRIIRVKKCWNTSMADTLERVHQYRESVENEAPNDEEKQITITNLK